MNHPRPVLAGLTALPTLRFAFGVVICGAVLNAAAAIKTLVVTGGHGFEQAPFHRMFSENPELAVTTAAQSSRTNASAYERTDLFSYDVVVLYDMQQSLTENQKANFIALFKRGIGLVVLHHALCSYQDWPGYELAIGGQYAEPDPKRPGTVTEAVGYQHDVEVPLVIVQPGHPVTAGLESFPLHDEIYWGYRVGKDVTPLVTTTHPKSGKPLVWTKTHGQSRVVCIQPGHGKEAFENANYRRLLGQSIRWAARQPADNERPKRAGADSGASLAPRVFVLNAAHLAATRERVRQGDEQLQPALEDLIKEAKSLLRARTVSVMDKTTVPPSGDKHDYLSQAPYFWPNPNTSNGLPYLRKDGERNPEISRLSDHANILAMPEKARTLALAWYFTGEPVYAEKGAAFLRAWFINPVTRMNPHFKYAQFIPGVNTGRGIGLIESRGLTGVVDAAGLLAGSSAWTGADQRALKAWFTDFLTWMLESDYGRDEAAAKNNHGTYYDVQVVSFALFLGRDALAKEVVSKAREKRIRVQIEPDGRQPLELARTKAWGYSVGNLSGLFLLAKLGDSVGVDLWHYETLDGRSLRRAFDYLAPFGLGEKPWPHAQLGGWFPQGFPALARQAALRFQDPRYAAISSKLPATQPSDQSVLLGW